jgi:ring-1,2-phenylacetyl-CoA epoxidase subunit PaaC
VTQAATTPTAVAALVAQLADNKLFLGRRYAEWCTGAPTLEAAVAAASMAQDEIGHARSFYPLLQDLAGPSSETEPETRTQFTNVEILNAPFESWTDFVAANFLLDTALTVVLEAARASSLEPLGQRARRIIGEEQLHWLHGEGWTRRLAAWDPGLADALIASLAKAALYCHQILSAATPELVEMAVLDAGAATLRARFGDRVGPILRLAGLPPL